MDGVRTWIGGVLRRLPPRTPARRLERLLWDGGFRGAAWREGDRRWPALARRGWLLRFDAEGDFFVDGEHAALVQALFARAGAKDALAHAEDRFDEAWGRVITARVRAADPGGGGPARAPGGGGGPYRGATGAPEEGGAGATHRFARALRYGERRRNSDWVDGDLVLFAANLIALEVGLPFVFASLPTEDQTAAWAALPRALLPAIRREGLVSIEPFDAEELRGYRVAGGQRVDGGPADPEAPEPPSEPPDDPRRRAGPDVEHLTVDTSPFWIEPAREVDGIPVRGEAAWGAHGRLQYATLAADTTIAGLPCKGGERVTLAHDGRPSRAVLGAAWHVGDLRFEPGCQVTLYEESLVPAEVRLGAAQELRGQRFPEQSAIEFGEEGDLWWIELPRPWRVGGRWYRAGAKARYEGGAWVPDEGG